jgi:quercetin dioxygenase-like cupin family protein
MSDNATTPNEGQLPQNLPGIKTYITGHDPATGKAIIQSTRPGKWQSYDDKLMAFNVAYTTSEFPANLNNDKDLSTHDTLMNNKTLGLVNANGTVCRVVDFAPNYECMMHRTQSLDYGIVLEGSIDLVLDSGETQQMSRGDIAVQRATMHSWKNNSDSDWARMVFVLQDCKKLEVGGRELKEDLGRGTEGLPASGNDS